MASETQSITVDSLPRPVPEEMPEEMPQRSETPSRSSDTSRQQESPKQAGQNPAPRNRVPPKRLSTVTNRKAAAKSETASRSGLSSTSHSNPGNGLSKPPTRPLPSSSTRRPPPGVALAAAANSGFKKRASVSSIDIKRKGDESASEEIFKPSTTLSENRPLKTDGKKQTTNLSSISQRTPLNPSTNTEKKSAFSRQNIGSPTKAVLRPTTHSSHPSTTHSTSQSVRPLASSVRGAIGESGPDARKKRLSTIPASPAPSKPEPASSNLQLSSPASTSPVRPKLSTRKSTMSVSLEQSLREMEVVHKMLHVAMAEDGDENDEVKEEYGKKVDESLTFLKAKLEEARRSQGFEVEDSGKDSATEVPKAVTVDGETGLSPGGVSTLKTNLTESQSKVAKLKAELAALQSKVLDREILPEDALQNVTESAKKLETYREDLKKVRSEQKSKNDDLIAIHTRELEDVQSRLDEAEARHKEHIRQSLEDIEAAKHAAAQENAEKAKDMLNSQLQEHTSTVEIMERQLDEEKSNGLKAWGTVRDLQSEISALQKLSSESDQRQIEARRKSDEQHLMEREDALKMKDQDISKLQDEIQELRAIQSRQLEEAKSTAQDKCRTLESELAALHRKLDELEASHQEANMQHKEAMDAKQEEIRTLGIVIEDFQSQTLELHAMIEQGIDKAKLDFLGEHEKVISDLDTKHCEEIEAATRRHEEEMECVQSDHLDALRILNDKLADREEEMERARSVHRDDLGILNDKVAELEESLENSESASETAKITNAKASETIHALNGKLRALELERDEAQATILALNDGLHQTEDEILSLKKCLDTLGDENRNREAEHLRDIKKMKDELNAIAKLVEAKTVEQTSALEIHAEEVQQLQMNHAKNIEEQALKGEATLEYMQKKYDELLRDYEQAENDNRLNLKSLQAEHNEALSQHMRDLENFRMAHLKEKDELKSEAERLRSEDKLMSIESSNAEAAKAEEKYQQDIRHLQQQHEITCISLREKLDDAEKEKFTTQHAHDAALSEIGSQLQHYTELLAGTEGQLRVTKQALDDRISPEKLGDILHNLDELELQLANAQTEANQAKKEVTSLKTAAQEADNIASDKLQKEISEVTTQHAAEISKLQGTMSLDSEKREKERKQGAEVRDRLVAESERMRLDLLAANERAKEHEKALHFSATKLADVSNQLSAARQATERHQSDHQKAKEELKAAQAEIEKQSASLHAEKKVSSDLARELEVLRKAADVERERNTSFEKRLREAMAISEKHAARVREVESALKVISAELMESQTERPNGATLPASPTPKSNLHSTRSAHIDQTDEGEGDGEKEDEDLGPRIEGNLAGMQEQVRQMDDLNKDMMEEERRFLSRMSIVTNLGPSSDLTGPREADEEEES